MNQIGYPNNILGTRLFIGDQFSAANYNGLMDNNIHFILNVTPVNIPKFNNIIYMQIPLLDTEYQDIVSSLKEAFDFIDYATITNNSNILIHCQAGISRSAAILIAYLMYRYRMTYNDAFNIVKGARNIINPNRGFVNQLKNFETKLFNN